MHNKWRLQNTHLIPNRNLIDHKHPTIIPTIFNLENKSEENEVCNYGELVKHPIPEQTMMFPLFTYEHSGNVNPQAVTNDHIQSLDTEILLQSIMSHLHPTQREMVNIRKFKQTAEAMDQLNGNKILYGASDGSYLIRQGAYGFCITDKLKTEMYINGEKTSGHPWSASAYEEEEMGALALVTTLLVWQRCYVTINKLEIFIDNQSVVSQILKIQDYTYLDPLTMHHEIFKQIQFTLNQLKYQIMWSWTHSHQTPNGRLDRELNHQDDNTATKQQFIEKRIKKYYPMFSDGTLLIRDKPVTSKYKQVIHYEMCSEIQIEYLSKKNQWNSNTFDTIDWKAHGSAFRQLQVHQKIQVMKIQTGWASEVDR